MAKSVKKRNFVITLHKYVKFKKTFALLVKQYYNLVIRIWLRLTYKSKLDILTKNIRRWPMAIHVEESALNDLRNALETAGTEYKNNYARLQNLISEITSGDIQGDPANDLLAKFQAKDETFKSLQQTIDEALEYMGAQKQAFTGMISELSSTMK